MTSAGDLRHRLLFQRRSDADDGWGNIIEGAGPFETVFSVRAAMQPKFGTETVMAARLAGQQPYVVTVRASMQMAAVTPAWRLVDARNSNRIFAITAPVTDPDGRNQWRELLVMEGKPS